MDDPKKLLDGPVEDVKTRLVGLSHDDLLKLREAEGADQKRADVLTAIEGAISVSDAARAGGTEKTLVNGALVTSDVANASVVADLDTSGPAGIAGATTFSTSGAPVQIVPDVDPGHPAVDNNPRERTTAQMNRIDFNDPSLSGPEAAAQMLAKQGGGTAPATSTKS